MRSQRESFIELPISQSLRSGIVVGLVILETFAVLIPRTVEASMRMHAPVMIHEGYTAHADSLVGANRSISVATISGIIRDGTTDRAVFFRVHERRLEDSNPWSFRPPVFKTGAIVHSAKPPCVLPGTDPDYARIDAIDLTDITFVAVH